jgi:diguanylate cyclase (GGDEF)-like protein
VSTPVLLTVVLAAMAVIAAVTYHLSRGRTPARCHAAVTAARAARRDGLTGLDNRAAFHAALAGTAGRRRTVAVVLINLDGTRVFVRRFGHRGLDQLLVLTAGRLQQVASAAGGTAFRLRRDEFAVILEDPARAAHHAARLVAAVAEPTELHCSGRPITVTVTACAGVATFTPHADSDRRLALLRADQALRTAKTSGPGRTARFDPATVRGPGAAAPR